MLRRGSLLVRVRGWYLVLRESCTVKSGWFPSPKLENTFCSTEKAVVKECRKGHACVVAGGDILGTSFGVFNPTAAEGAKFASPADRAGKKTTILCVRPDTRHYRYIHDQFTGPLVSVMSYPNAALMHAPAGPHVEMYQDASSGSAVYQAGILGRMARSWIWCIFPHVPCYVVGQKPSSFL
jgi:hypothetical protein